MRLSLTQRAGPAALDAFRRLGGVLRSHASDARKETFAYMTPAFAKTTRSSLEQQWDNLGFGIRTMNGYVRCTWSEGSWDNCVFVPAPYQLMHINAGVLHYGVSVFEGMKAFACKDGKVRLMNPVLNAVRMQNGADRLLMPQVPTELFVNAVKEAVRRNREFVPPYGHGASMYIRPLLFASGQMLALLPPANEYTFFVTVMPTGGYFGKGADQGIHALVCEDYDRAAPRGTGGVKAGGNYAADLLPVQACQKTGYNTALYLDAKHQKYVEEFSVANFIGITHDNRYVTPNSDAILKSTTNRMLQQLAKDRNMIVEERPVNFLEEIDTFKEIGMCGTAAVVVKVSSITQGAKTWEFNKFETLASLRDEYQSIQLGELPDKHNWMDEVCDVVDDADTEFESSSADSFVQGMVDAQEKGTVQALGSEALHGLERRLLEHVFEKAIPGDVDSVLDAMDSFWSRIYEKQGTDKWNVRAQVIEDAVCEKVSAKVNSREPVRCLELGTYCGYSTLRIAKHLPEGSTLLSLERDPLFGAIATKIVEFAGLECKIKIWVGTVHSEITDIVKQLGHRAADFVLCDHSKERFVPDLKLLQECGSVDANTRVLGDVAVYPGDAPLPWKLQEEISAFFGKSEQFVIAML